MSYDRRELSPLVGNVAAIITELTDRLILTFLRLSTMLRLRRHASILTFRILLHAAPAVDFAVLRLLAILFGHDNAVQGRFFIGCRAFAHLLTCNR